MKLDTTPPYILTLVTLVPQSKLAFGQTPHAGWLSGLLPLAITILQCTALLAAGRCLVIRPYTNSSKLLYSDNVIIIINK